MVHDSVHPLSSIPLGCLGGDGIAFCGAETETEGRELWFSDGTAAGTRLTRDISPGPDSSSPAPISMLGRKVLFGADDGTGDSALWVSDGTLSGTFELAAVVPAAGPEWAVEIAGIVFFAGRDEVGEPGLWRTDGTVAGTSRVATVDIRSDEIAALGSVIFFAAHETRAAMSSGGGRNRGRDQSGHRHRSRGPTTRRRGI